MKSLWFMAGIVDWEKVSKEIAKPQFLPHFG